jgi:very-short-patch-repair endonuclease
VSDGVLRPGAAFIDCARTRPFDEALSVADSALRHGSLTERGMLVLAEQVPTTGRTQCLRVAREASGLAANPFESVLRAIALDVAGLDLRPQLLIAEDGWSGWPDLVDRSLRLVVEADSFEFHGRRKALKRDCERYNALVVRGWVVLRFAWEHVMFDPAYVRDCLARWAQRQETPRSRRRVRV